MERPNAFADRSRLPNTSIAQHPNNYGSLLERPTHPVERPIGGSGNIHHIDGPNGGQAIIGRGPNGAGIVAKGPEGGTAVAIRGQGGYSVAGVRGPNGGVAVAAKGPYGYRSYVRLPEGSRYIGWRGSGYWRNGRNWYQPYYYAGSVYYGECSAPYGWDGDDLGNPTDGTITTFVLNGVTYFYRNSVYYIMQDGRYVVVPNPYAQTAQAPDIDPKAKEQLQSMSNSLARFKSGRVVIRDISDEILDSGQKVQVESRRAVAVRAPDKMAVDFSSDDEVRRIVYDGSKITVFEKNKNLYSQQAMPPTLSQTMDVMASKYGMAVPAVEMLRPSLVDKLIPQVLTAQYLGPQTIEGDSCQRISLSLDWADVELWILDADMALPRRAMISYKKIPSTPKYVMNFTNWDTSSPPDSAFEMKLPGDATRVEMRPMGQKD